VLQEILSTVVRYSRGGRKVATIAEGRCIETVAGGRREQLLQEEGELQPCRRK
jgi:hypothetical protein